MDRYKQYNKFYEEYIKQDRNFAKQCPEDRKIVLSRLKNIKGKTLLDLGCGNGDDLGNFLARGAIVTGIDSSSKMINEAKSIYSKASLLIQNFNKLSIKDNYFDIVYSRFAIHYAKKPERPLKEIHRILKTKGEAHILAAHPLLLWHNKKIKDYYKQEIVDLPIMDGLIVKEPSHMFADYLTPFVLDNFYLKEFIESRQTTIEGKNHLKIPTFFYMRLQKK